MVSLRCDLQYVVQMINQNQTKGKINKHETVSTTADPVHASSTPQWVLVVSTFTTSVCACVNQMISSDASHAVATWRGSETWPVSLLNTPRYMSHGYHHFPAAAAAALHVPLGYYCRCHSHWYGKLIDLFLLTCFPLLWTTMVIQLIYLFTHSFVCYHY